MTILLSRRLGVGLSLPFLFLVLLESSGLADLRPEKVHTSENRKTGAYIEDGLFIGGDRAINAVAIEGIRFAPSTPANKDFERLVIDTKVFQDGRPPAIQRPAYFQASLGKASKELTFSIWGNPKLDFNIQALLGTFKKSTLIQRVRLFPRVEEDSWTFTLDLKSPVIAEVFELDNPVRIILDLKKSR